MQSEMEIQLPPLYCFHLNTAATVFAKPASKQKEFALNDNKGPTYSTTLQALSVGMFI